MPAPIGTGRVVIRKPQFAPESRALFAAMTTAPTYERQVIIDNFIRGLISDGVWAKLDILYVLAAPTAQAAGLNWKAPRVYSLTVAGTPTFTADQGYTGNGSDGILTATSYAPATAGLNFSQDSASFGIYVRTAPTTASRLLAGMTESRIASNPGLTAYNFRLNDATSSTYTFGTATGHFTLRRTNSADRQLFRNAVQEVTAAVASTTVSSNFTMLAGSTLFSDAQLSLGYAGGGLSDADIAALDARIVTLKAAIGF